MQFAIKILLSLTSIYAVAQLIRPAAAGTADPGTQCLPVFGAVTCYSGACVPASCFPYPTGLCGYVCAGVENLGKCRTAKDCRGSVCTSANICKAAPGYGCKSTQECVSGFCRFQDNGYGFCSYPDETMTSTRSRTTTTLTRSPTTTTSTRPRTTSTTKATSKTTASPLPKK